MRVAEDATVQQLGVFADLRLRMKSAARVVEVDMALGIEPPVFRSAQRVQRTRAFVLGIRLQERGVRRALGSDVSRGGLGVHSLPLSTGRA